MNSIIFIFVSFILTIQLVQTQAFNIDFYSNNQCTTHNALLSVSYEMSDSNSCTKSNIHTDKIQDIYVQSSCSSLTGEWSYTLYKDSNCQTELTEIGEIAHAENNYDGNCIESSINNEPVFIKSTCPVNVPKSQQQAQTTISAASSYRNFNFGYITMISILSVILTQFI